MAALGSTSIQCQKHAVYASTFRNHFDASMVIFILGIFIIQLSIRFLIAINGAPKNNSRFSQARSKIVAKFVCSTILLGIAASLFTFQILFILFVRHCLDGTLHETSLILTCVVAALNGIFVSVGVVAWVGSTVVLVLSSSSRSSDANNEAEKQPRESAIEIIEGTVSSSELQRRDEKVLRQANVQPPTPTLPPYKG